MTIRKSNGTLGTVLHTSNPVERISSFGETIIDTFRNEYDFLSNFFGASLIWKMQTFSTSEHAYQWEKTDNPIEKESILFNRGQHLSGKGSFLIPTTPGQAKRKGDLVTLRDDWEDVRLDIMYEILKAKFTQNWDLRQKLVNTGDALLIEGNTWCDNFWGQCTCEKCQKKEKLNVLGKLLMRLRTELSNPSKVYCLGCPVALDDKL